MRLLSLDIESLHLLSRHHARWAIVNLKFLVACTEQKNGILGVRIWVWQDFIVQQRWKRYYLPKNGLFLLGTL